VKWTFNLFNHLKNINKICNHKHVSFISPQNVIITLYIYLTFFLYLGDHDLPIVSIWMIFSFHSLSLTLSLLSSCYFPLYLCHATSLSHFPFKLYKKKNEPSHEICDILEAIINILAKWNYFTEKNVRQTWSNILILIQKIILSFFYVVCIHPK
jgi:hypothetical protein